MSKAGKRWAEGTGEVEVIVQHANKQDETDRQTDRQTDRPIVIVIGHSPNLQRIHEPQFREESIVDQYKEGLESSISKDNVL